MLLYSSLIDSLLLHSYTMPAIDVVEMQDGRFTAIDNRRLTSAREANVPVFVRKYRGIDPIPQDQANRFPGCQTWSDAVERRVSHQKPKSLAKANPLGFNDIPRKTDGAGAGGVQTHPFFKQNAALVSEALTSLFNVFTSQKVLGSGRKRR
jgi:hypothetical protein